MLTIEKLGSNYIVTTKDNEVIGFSSLKQALEFIQNNLK